VNRSVRVLLVFVVIVALSLVTIVVLNIVHNAQNPSSKFPSGWQAENFTVVNASGAAPTDAQVADAAEAILLDLEHLGSPGAAYHLKGDVIGVGVPGDQVGGLIAIQGRTLQPKVQLVRLLGSAPNTEVPDDGQECGNAIQKPLCSLDRGTYGTPDQKVLDGPDITGATAAGNTIRFTLTQSAQQSLNQAFDTAAGHTLAFTAQYDQSVFGLTSFTDPGTVTRDGRILKLSPVHATRVAALLRLARGKFSLSVKD
jgi:hypothetical protein